MGGFFGAVARRDVTMDVFFGVDYHSHLGTKRGGMIVHEVAEDKIIDALTLGCRPLYNSLASTRFEGERVYL